MSTFRKHFRVSWDGREPVDIVTNAWDMAEGSEWADEHKGQGTFYTIHHCLKRYGHDVPPFNEWMDVLDELTAERSENGAERTDPTAPMAYTGEPLPLQS